MQQAWEFFLQNWIIFAVVFIMIMMVLRLMLSDPKYSMKEIAKKPWLIFQLFAHAAQDTVEILQDAQEFGEKIEKEVDKTTEQVEDVKKSVEELKDSVK